MISANLLVIEQMGVAQPLEPSSPVQKVNILSHTQAFVEYSFSAYAAMIVYQVATLVRERW